MKLQGAVTVDVGGGHGAAGKLTTTADVEKEVVDSASALPEQKVMASSGAVHPDTPMRSLARSRRYLHWVTCLLVAIFRILAC